MKKSLLYRIFSTLEKNERRNFKKWLNSEVHNQRGNVSQLLQYMDDNSEKVPMLLKKEVAWVSLFPDKKYDEAQMNRLMSYLLSCLKEYLAWREWQQDSFDQKLRLSRAFKRLGLEDEFDNSITDAEQALENQAFRDTDYHIQLLELHREKQEHAALTRRNMSDTQSIIALEKAIVGLSTLNLLRHVCMLQNNQNVFKEANASPSLSIRLAENLSVTELPDPASQLYFYLWNALKNPETEDYFQQTKKLLNLHFQLFRSSELREIYLAMINYCIRRANSGKSEFVREIFDLYRTGLEKKALFENGTLSKFTYKNAVSAAVGLEEFAWTAQFLEEYKAFLPNRERQATYTYNLAVLYFRQKKYDQTLEVLRNTDFGDDVHTSLNARSMLLRIYYEKNFLDALESLLDSFQIFIKRQKKLGYQGENYLNLIRFTRILLKSNLKDKGLSEKIKAEIMGTSALAEKVWLLEKVNS
jgi:hypothetical protein